MKNILITGTAGFIGFHLAKKLLADKNISITGIDNLNSYYEVSLKDNRNKILLNHENYTFKKVDISSYNEIINIFENNDFDVVINLAAQAGVRYSIENPFAYSESNLTGFMNILECCRKKNIKHLIYASSSSVYGMNKKLPFSEDDNVDHPVSLYAATKKSNELLAYSYSHLYKIPVTGLRFFTVYGPWGRPDMAYFKFTKSILEGKPIDVFNNGNMMRDFTYIDDIVDGIIKLIDLIPDHIGSANNIEAPYSIYNIGNNKPVNLNRFIETIEKNIGKKAIIKYMPMQPGDVLETYADISKLNKATGFIPKTPIEEGMKNFIAWYLEYYCMK